MRRILAFVTVVTVATIGCGGGTSQTLTSPTESATSSATLEPNDAKRYAIGGIVIAVEKPNRSVSGARVDVLAGANGGAFTYSDGTGAFVLSGLTPGTLTLQISKPGFQTWVRNDIILESDTKIAAELFLAPPSNASGVTATGRCNDGTWTWARTLPEACMNAGGIAYGVCPGPLCKSGS